MKLFVTGNPEIAPDIDMVAIVNNGAVDLSDVPDNACTEIFAVEALDYVDRNNISKFLENLVSKMRQGAIMTIVGIDLQELTRATHLQEISADQFHDIVLNRRRGSISPAKEIISILRGLNQKLITYKTVKGVSYEIKTAREK